MHNYTAPDVNMLHIAESSAENNKGTGVDFISVWLLPSKRFDSGTFGQVCNACPQDIQMRNMSMTTSRPYSYRQIADYFGVHFTTVGRIIRRAGNNMHLFWTPHVAACSCKTLLHLAENYDYPAILKALHTNQPVNVA